MHRHHIRKSLSKEQAKQIANINKAIAEKVGVALSKTMQGEFQEKAKKIMHDKVVEEDRKSTRLNSSHKHRSRMPSSA